MIAKKKQQQPNKQQQQKSKKKGHQAHKTISNSAKLPFNNYVFSKKELYLTPWAIHE